MRFQTFKNRPNLHTSMEGFHRDSHIYSHRILVLEYTKTRIYGKYTEFFVSEDLRYIKDFQL